MMKTEARVALERYTTVVCKLNTKVGKVILFCGDCNVPLATTVNKHVYCPGCTRKEGVENVNIVLCCSRCKYPLYISLGHGDYCDHCNSNPGADDRFLKTI